jgi:hypothetical protein
MAFSAPTEDVEKMRPSEGEALSMTADVAVDAGQVVKLTGNQTVSPSDTDGEEVIGVAVQSVASGDQVTVLGNSARVLLTAGAAVGAGNALASDGGTSDEGTVEPANSTGDSILGYALEAAGSSGDTFVAVLDRGGEVN